MLLFAVAVGAQVQVQHVQQQQVLDNQEQAVVVQQQQIGVQAQGCPGSRVRERVEDPKTNFESGFDVTGEAIRITYDVEVVGGGSNPDDELFIRVRDEDEDEVVYCVTV